LLYPTLRRGASWFVDVVVLHRPDYRSLRAAVSRKLQRSESAPEALSAVCELLAPALNARSVVWHASSAHEDETLGSAVVFVDAQATEVIERLDSLSAGGSSWSPTVRPAAIVVVPTAEEPRHILVITELMGGRRLLSDDVATL